MKKIFIIKTLVLGLVLGFDANAQIDSIPVCLAGRVASVDSAFSLPYIHVINKHTGLGVISDSLGVFKTKLFKNDTLIFRCLGFSDYEYQLPDSLNSSIYFIQITMSPKSYELNMVDVYSLTQRNQFRYEFKHMPINEEGRLNRDIVIDGVTNPNYKKLREAERPIYPTFIGGATGFLYKMSHKSHSYEKLERNVVDDKLRQQANEKYSMSLLSEFTGYQGDKLLSFYIYLDFKSDYVYKTNAYDIYLLILKSMSSFEDHYKEHGLPLNFLEKDNVE